MKKKIKSVYLKIVNAKIVKSKPNNKSKPKYKKKKITTALKQKVWDLHFKRTSAFCKCCSVNIITLNNCHMAHILAEKNGGSTDIYNLVPCCANCNLCMGTQHLEEFKKQNGFDNKKITDNLRETMLNHLLELHNELKN
jgi:5-methylcytosine-specific restriction endonuclease McrA